MNDPIRIVIAGEPVAAPRPRFRNIHKRDGSSFVSTYNPAHFNKWQQTVRLYGQQAMNGRPPLSGPLTMELQVFLPIPQSFSKIKRGAALNGNIWPTTRPDTDNYIKSWDALTGLVWNDDSQIVYIVASKHYSDRPRIELTIDEMRANVTPTLKEPEALPLFNGKS